MSDVDALLILAAMLFLKHLFADGPLQTDYQVANKGTWLHPAGLAHAGIHSALTAICIGSWLYIFGFYLSILSFCLIILMEFVAHYTIDYSKSQVESGLNWVERSMDSSGNSYTKIKNRKFFSAFLADQTLHSLTYLLMIGVVEKLLPKVITF